MTKKFIIIFLILWILIKLFEYYFVLYFFSAFFWIGISFAIFIITTIQIIKLIKNRKKIKLFGILNIIILIIILFLNIENRMINRMIEKIDWIILFPFRKNTVEKVINSEIKVEWNNTSYDLAYKFPIISGFGNNININRYDDKTVTVEFYAKKSFFEHRQTLFVYTNNNVIIKNVEDYVSNNSRDNWKIKENWYRLYVKDIFDDMSIE